MWISSAVFLVVVCCCCFFASPLFLASLFPHAPLATCGRRTGTCSLFDRPLFSFLSLSFGCGAPPPLSDGRQLLPSSALHSAFTHSLDAAMAATLPCHPVWQGVGCVPHPFSMWRVQCQQLGRNAEEHPRRSTCDIPSFPFHCLPVSLPVGEGTAVLCSRANQMRRTSLPVHSRFSRPNRTNQTIQNSVGSTNKHPPPPTSFPPTSKSPNIPDSSSFVFFSEPEHLLLAVSCVWRADSCAQRWRCSRNRSALGGAWRRGLHLTQLSSFSSPSALLWTASSRAWHRPGWLLVVFIVHSPLGQTGTAQHTTRCFVSFLV